MLSPQILEKAKMTTFDQLAQIITPSLLSSAGVPTASIAILRDGKILNHTITTGPHKADSETLYQACSISKAIAALGVARLIDQGKLSYSTRIASHLPQSTIDILVDSKTAHLFPLVTVGMLLSHTSGLSQHGFPGYEVHPPSAETVLSGAAPANTPRVHFSSFPGAQWSYSGGGFVVLQLFLEALLSKPFPDIMRELVLEPLGMTRSFYGALPKDEKNYTEPYMTAATPAKAGHHTLSEMAAGGLWSTPSDLLKAVSAIQRSSFLKPGSAKQLLAPIASGTLGEPVGIWSHGWAVTPTLFGHGGSNDPGYRCYVCGSFAQQPSALFPTEQQRTQTWPEGTGLAIMTNSVLGEDLIPRLLNALVYLLKLPPQAAGFPSWSGGLGKAVALPDALMVSKDGWQEWTGAWTSSGEQAKEWSVVQLQDGKPGLSFDGHEAMGLVPAAAPKESTGEGKDVFWFVVDGLDVGVKLTWEGEERVVRIMQDQTETLHKRG